MTICPIAYSTTPSSLGCLLVAGTADGICSVKLADDKADLVRELEWELEVIAPTNAAPVVNWMHQLANYLSGGAWPELPTAIAGTEFQQQVWQSLRQIPVGTTMTYGELARKLGKSPAAARAVGRACATNPAALVVPCHRVVGSTGNLTGFRWGLDRKRALLELERQYADQQLELLG
ncbi:MAG: methylated-DNA--[protein]-cysteine S-methyltransferase [Cyanobacteria bacterium P01_E01_bin.34]